ISALLTACGGSGGGSNANPPKTSSAPPASRLATSSVSSSDTISSTSASSVSSDAQAVAVTGFIVVAQFGYLPDSKKVAVIRDPQTGYDAALSFTPGATYQLVDLDSNTVVHSATPVSWKSDATYALAGDKAWWFDFSAVTTPGRYAVVDKEKNVRSPAFKIAADVYKPVLKHALRTFFYQRAGFAKQAPYAETGWTDGASH